MISIVVPLYNKEKYIENTIQTVLKQTYQDFELIVVNDGSTDKSVSIVSSIKDARVTLINQDNAGVSVARNTGIEVAKYSWIAFLDADDWWAPTFLEEIKNTIEQFTNEKIFATGRSRVFNELVERYDNEYLPKNNATSFVNYFKIIAKYLPPINSSNVVIHKTLLSDNKFKEGMRQHEDHDLWIRLCVSNEVVFINKSLSFYRKAIATSASQNKFYREDFENYINTIIKVNNTLNTTNKLYFKNYFERFLFIKYLTSYGHYNLVEHKTLLNKIKPLLKTPAFLFLKVVSVYLKLDIYKVYKKLPL